MLPVCDWIPERNTLFFHSIYCFFNDLTLLFCLKVNILKAGS
ncbi:putative membrane protein [Bacteroides fragilis str. I1345]|nr:putative membrane protein [Bacteroides fragilis str. 2-F-2 \